MSDERILLHGPCLQDLTDFLWFDKVVYPTTMALIRPRTLGPGYVGYPPEEPVPESVREQLAESGFIISPGELFFASPAGELAAKLLDDPGAILGSLQVVAQKLPGIIAENSLAVLETPATSVEVGAWLEDLDRKTIALATSTAQQGRRAVPKLYAEDAARALRPGWDLVLSLNIQSIPFVDSVRIDIREYCAFLADDATKRKRAQLFDWQDVLSTGGQLQLQLALDRIESALDAYTKWIGASGFATKSHVGELLIALDNALVTGLTELDIRRRAGADTDCPGAAFELGIRGISLAEGQHQAPGQELAYITHSLRIPPRPADPSRLKRS